MQVRLATIAALLIALAPCAAAKPMRFAPKTDARGFIDVWQLRRDVARAESHYYAAISPCEYRFTGHADETKAEERAYERCRKHFDRLKAVSERVDAAFNRAWRPVILRSMQLGDPIAEVIMRNCDTTPVLDRHDIAATCDADSDKRNAAIARLRSIGFMPAVPNHTRSLVPFFVPSKVLQNAPRAFTVDLRYLNNGFDNFSQVSEALGKLRLNRQPLTPGYLTFGSESYYRGGSKLWYPAKGIADHRKEWASTFNALDTAMDEWLRRDPRWAVFLLHRIGHYEWVPEGMTTTTGRLNSVWLGRWKLIAQTPDWNQPLQPVKGRAVIRYRHGGVVINTVAATALMVFPDVSNCTLRYSGGVTYVPDPGRTQYTALGGYTGKYADQVLAELDPSKRYKQVLMQCKGAESDDTDRARFLLHARNYMIEIGSLSGDPNHVAARVYRRVH